MPARENVVTSPMMASAAVTVRLRDGKEKIDPSGTLPDGQSFAGPAELKTIIQGKKELFARNLAEKMLTYGLGRGLEYYDRPTVQKIVAGVAAYEVVA